MSLKTNFVGKYQKYPDATGARLAEGGCRLTQAECAQHEGAPLVSIITVCLNSAKTIEQTIQSVLDQSYKNIEYIILDGGSTDATLDIIKKYESEIDYFVSEPDNGLYYAMNKGLELAQGDYILFLNSDDWYTPDCVSALVAAKDYSGCDFVSALALYVSEETGRNEVLRAMPFDHSLYLRMPLRHETMLLPASLYDRLGPYDTDYRILSDREYTVRLFDADVTHYEVPRALLNFRTSGISNTNIELLNREKDALLSAVFPFLNLNERNRIGDQDTAGPDTFIEIANAHLDEPKFVKSCRALLADRKANGGKKWRSADLSRIAVADKSAYPKVSVILPFYEAEKTIRASLESVLSQSLKEIEVICINDCAIDASEQVVEKYKNTDQRVKLVRNQKNIGLGASRNAGVRAASGRYIFHLDPDDILPAEALEKLYSAAVKHEGKMVKGAYSAKQGLHEKAAGGDAIKFPCGVNDRVVANTTLKETPALLKTTEGHWSYLYDADFARQVTYPTDLKMGQDSIFLVNALAKVKSVTLLPELVYNYMPNSNSAMNRFSAQKFFDALEWRRRAWHVLRDAGLQDIGDTLLFNYWSGDFFDALAEKLAPEEFQRFFEKLYEAFDQAGYANGDKPIHPKLAPLVESAFSNAIDAEENTGLRIATFTTRDYGGGGQGTQRRVEALRNKGQSAEIYCLFQKSDKPYVYTVPPASAIAEEQAPIEDIWRNKSVVTQRLRPELRASELFSKPGALVDFQDLDSIFEIADIVHLHWVVGLIDYENTPVQLGNRAVAWTLADMNAFTGGCHYSEGCLEYRNECRKCPLLSGESDLAHETWKTKKKAYSGMRNLHVICPSQWLADHAAASSLFGDRPIHVIPNALPVDRFRPTNKLEARQRLGLPLDKKLVVFGADSLSNHRKGGDILKESFLRLKSRGQLQDVEGLFFGANSLDIGVKAHKMGRVTDERKLSLIYAAGDVYAFPSREDNAPLTVAEALLSGTPVVSFPVGNAPDIVKHRDTGYIAEYQNVEDFADGLIWALNSCRDEAAIKRSIRCHWTAREHNHPETAADRHIALYHEMLVS